MSNKATKREMEEMKQGKDVSKSYRNDEITVFWRPKLCIHSANCLIGLPGVFDSGERPWININGASSNEIIKTINTCPSRALLYLKNTSASPGRTRKKSRKRAKFARIKILKNGPAIISGNFGKQNLARVVAATAFFRALPPAPAALADAPRD